MHGIKVGMMIATAMVLGQLSVADAQGATDRRSCAARVGTFSVYFNSGSSEIAEASLNELKEWVAKIRQTGCTYGGLTVEGHRDSIEDAGGEKELSARRATVVARWVAMIGIPANKIKESPYGDEHPFLPHSENGVPANRRARIVFE